MTAANLRYDAAVRARITIRGAAAGGTARKAVLEADDPHLCNTFDAPETVKPDWTDQEAVGSSLDLELPPASVVMIEIPLG